MPNKEIDEDFILEAIESLSLSKEERALLVLDPTLLPTMWQDTADTVVLRYFKAIMQAQVDKAMRGDTAAAKFLTEFSTPTTLSTAGDNEPVKWESIAISIRNRLSLESSAEELAVHILQSVSELSDDQIIALLKMT